MVFEEIILFFGNQIELITVLVAFFGGIESILFLGILSGQGIAPLWKIIVFSYIGYFLFEIMWFWIARSKIAEIIKKRKTARKTYRHAVKIIERITGGRRFFALLVAKIVYGSGIITLVYLSRERLTFRRFMAYNSVALFIHIVLISYIGWLGGRGLSGVVDLFDSARIFILFIVIFVVAFYFVQMYVRNWIEKKKNE